ncbi:zeaxanthin epoxidase, chloroplastic [Parachaetomium inaequale]|uniref:Zeaxanthin epoxidase, chloroplastic n=1 Tax=Parachaetomium inaequale TaxID=2588326 RepID=A0AAN6P979_9PEZI|nr:zeaxanthin epoxidase, chloroplastic [Parachaetomium inaequale]
MSNLPKSVVIVGGSLAGLLHGLYLKRHGSNVVILEQDPNSIRSSHQAGIAFGPAVQEILAKYDDTGMQSCIPATSTRIAYRRSWELSLNIARRLTSWGLLYRTLRANFDGLASEAVPNPPPPRAGDGKAEYRSGKKVTDLRYDNGVITISFVSQDGTEDSLTADLVIGADGLHSTVRTLLQAPTVKEYSGYVSWRGTVPEKDLPPATVQYFSNRPTLSFLKGTYLVCYPIPPDTGTFTPGTLLLNWVWYCPPSKGDLPTLLTDRTGHTHSNTVPAGLINPAIWASQLASTLESMPPPVATLLSSTKPSAVFVTKVNDALCERAVFCDGKVVLVGDALVTFRPHVAVATEHAARHCLGLGRVWGQEHEEGKGVVMMTMGEWEREVRGYGERVWMASRVLGVWGVGGWWEFWGVVWGFVRILVGGLLRGRR